MIFGLLLYWMGASEEARLLRVVYDLQIFYDGRSVIANLALNQLDRDRFSISCRKLPSGTLFTYWATREQNTLAFPKLGLVFVGAGDQAFQLIPGGPLLRRGDWLDLLLVGRAESLGTFTLWEDAPWKMISSQGRDVIIRWREKRRSQKVGFKDKVLQPRIKPGALVKPFSEFADYWAGHELD